MVNFKLGNEMWGWINQHDTSVGQRKILSPWQESNPWPPNTGRALYPLSYENSWRARSFNWVHIRHIWYSYIHIFIYSYIHIFIYSYIHIFIYDIFLCPTLESCWLNHLHISLPSLKFTIFINLSLLMMTSIALVLAVCRTPVIYELS